VKASLGGNTDIMKGIEAVNWRGGGWGGGGGGSTDRQIETGPQGGGLGTIQKAHREKLAWGEVSRLVDEEGFTSSPRNLSTREGVVLGSTGNL